MSGIEMLNLSTLQQAIERINHLFGCVNESAESDELVALLWVTPQALFPVQDPATKTA